MIEYKETSYGLTGYRTFTGTNWNGEPYSYTSEADDGTMPASVEALKEAIVGHRIVKVERENLTRLDNPDRWWGGKPALNLTLDDGTVVQMQEEGDCCAYTNLYEVIEHLPTVDHIITNVTAQEDDFERWHILADFGEVLELEVGWSCGNPFYYSYGFTIVVSKPADLAQADVELVA